jgi:uncharacterized membrane protein YgcG
MSWTWPRLVGTAAALFLVAVATTVGALVATQRTAPATTTAVPAPAPPAVGAAIVPRPLPPVDAPTPVAEHADAVPDGSRSTGAPRTGTARVEDGVAPEPARPRGGQDAVAAEPDTPKAGDAGEGHARGHGGGKGKNKGDGAGGGGAGGGGGED